MAKAIKKAAHGAKMKKAEMGAKLKSVPSDAKGLSKLPTSVRNKMGYMKSGGAVSYKEAYKNADKSKYKTFESFKAEAERFNERKYGTTQPTAKAKKFGLSKSETELTNSKVATKKPVIKTTTAKSDSQKKTVVAKEVSKKDTRKLKTADSNRKASAQRVKNSVSSGLKALRAKAQEERQAKREATKVKRVANKVKRKNESVSKGLTALRAKAKASRKAKRDANKPSTQMNVTPAQAKKIEKESGVRSMKHGGKVKAMYGAKMKK